MSTANQKATTGRRPLLIGWTFRLTSSFFCHQWIWRQKKYFITEPANQSCIYTTRTLLEITLMNSVSPLLQTQRHFWHDRLPIPILLWKIQKKIRNLRIIFISYCVGASSLINNNVNFDMCIVSLFLPLYLDGNVSSLVASMEKNFVKFKKILLNIIYQ